MNNNSFIGLNTNEFSELKTFFEGVNLSDLLKVKGLIDVIINDRQRIVGGNALPAFVQNYAQVVKQPAAQVSTLTSVSPKGQQTVVSKEPKMVTRGNRQFKVKDPLPRSVAYRQAVNWIEKSNIALKASGAQGESHENALYARNLALSYKRLIQILEPNGLSAPLIHEFRAWAKVYCPNQEKLGDLLDWSNGHLGLYFMKIDGEGTPLPLMEHETDQIPKEFEGFPLLVTNKSALKVAIASKAASETSFPELNKFKDESVVYVPLANKISASKLASPIRRNLDKVPKEHIVRSLSVRAHKTSWAEIMDREELRKELGLSNSGANLSGNESDSSSTAGNFLFLSNTKADSAKAMPKGQRPSAKN